VIVASASTSTTPIYRLGVHLAPDAKTRPRPLLLTVGGPVYCMQLANLARHIDASLACADYGPNRYEAAGGRALREEDWGDPVYDAAVAKVPSRLRSQGLNFSELIVVGVSYSGYANAELVATHPDMRPAALIVVDSYLDLPARYQALPAHHETRTEIERVLGGPLASRPAAYAARSPSNHLDGFATAIAHGMKLVVVWSLSPEEKREFLGATCSRLANAQWLANLATLMGTPITGYVTEMRHAHALWDRGEGLLQLAGIRNSGKPLIARPVIFQPDRPPPASSYC
jgi:pimeloyl-ACP methyl ester carboxylesterase